MARTTHKRKKMRGSGARWELFVDGKSKGRFGSESAANAVASLYRKKGKTARVEKR